jgi:Flp pilus assembly pilin Flp
MTRFYAFLQSFVAASRDSEAGQTMAEYAVVLGVITAAIMLALGLLSGSVSGALSTVASRI